jgi:hypothetical protein
VHPLNDFWVRLLQMSWLHLGDGTLARALVREAICAGMLNSCRASDILREYVLCATDACLRPQVKLALARFQGFSVSHLQAVLAGGAGYVGGMYIAGMR